MQIQRHDITNMPISTSRQKIDLGSNNEEPTHSQKMLQSEVNIKVQ